MIYDDLDLKRVACAVVEVCARELRGTGMDRPSEREAAIRSLMCNPSNLLRQAEAVAKEMTTFRLRAGGNVVARLPLDNNGCGRIPQLQTFIAGTTLENFEVEIARVGVSYDLRALARALHPDVQVIGFRIHIGVAFGLELWREGGHPSVFLSDLEATFCASALKTIAGTPYAR